ncbi:MAG: 50S ribosomal protein L17 [Dehalococcoidales bacterium]|nr:50S ribosomal protein L17 [Dehalococcoidales bacterium]
MDGRKLGRPSAPRKLMYRSMITDFLKNGKITTTEAKAKEIKGMAEKMITLGKKGDIAARRRAAMVLTDKDIVAKLFETIAPKFSTRPGGYTRLIKLGPRIGDGAPMAKLELVD